VEKSHTDTQSQIPLISGDGVFEGSFNVKKPHNCREIGISTFSNNRKTANPSSYAGRNYSLDAKTPGIPQNSNSRFHRPPHENSENRLKRISNKDLETSAISDIFRTCENIIAQYRWLGYESREADQRMVGNLGFNVTPPQQS
jgi:hypothetical protein